MGITFGKGNDPEYDDARRRLEEQNKAARDRQAQEQPRVAIVPGVATDEQVITIINHTISKMRSYGVIRVDVPQGARVARFIFWSNSSANWNSYGQAQNLSVRHGQGRIGISVDANMVLVVGSNKAQIDRILPRLMKLPLYAASYEARERGGFDLTQGEIPPKIKAAMAESQATGVPLDEQTRKALERKFKQN